MNYMLAKGIDKVHLQYIKDGLKAYEGRIKTEPSDGS